MEKLVTDMKRLIEYTELRKTTIKCNASTICTEVQLRHFKSAQVDLFVELDRLNCYGSAETTEIFCKEVVRYSSVMMDRLTRGEVSEIQFVQPEIKGPFWCNTKECLMCCANVELTNERPYKIVVENDDGRSEITGKTDHTIKMLSCDFHILTFEDKQLNFPMGKKEVCQVQSQIIEEVNAMDLHLQQVPLEYCGILQNGVTWIFLYRKVKNGNVKKGRIMWNYVVAPRTFTDGVVNEENCRIVARLLEHAYYVADQIATQITIPRMIVPLPSANLDASESEGDEQSDHENNLPSEGGDRSATAMCFQTETRATTTQGQTNIANSKGTRTTKNPGHSHYFDKEDSFLPLSVHNLSMQPTLKKMVC
jgi:hypothetical protein